MRICMQGAWYGSSVQHVLAINCIIMYTFYDVDNNAYVVIGDAVHYVVNVDV